MQRLESSVSPHDFAETVHRAESELERRGVPVFAKIDHAANARSLGLEMPETLVLIFGAARGGTPVMLQQPAIAYELPLRLLIRQDGDRVVLQYRSPDELAADYGVPPELVAPLHLIDAVVQAACG